MDTDRKDSHLIEAVNASTTGHVVEWSQVVSYMRMKGHKLCDEEQYRKRMNQLVKQYLKVLIDCHYDYTSACNEWPLFAYINDMNLKPFFNDNDIITITHFRSLLVNNTSESVLKSSCNEPRVRKKIPIIEDLTETVNNKPIIKKC